MIWLKKCPIEKINQNLRLIEQFENRKIFPNVFPIEEEKEPVFWNKIE